MREYLGKNSRRFIHGTNVPPVFNANTRGKKEYKRLRDKGERKFSTKRTCLMNDLPVNQDNTRHRPLNHNNSSNNNDNDNTEESTTVSTSLLFKQKKKMLRTFQVKKKTPKDCDMQRPNSVLRTKKHLHSDNNKPSEGSSPPKTCAHKVCRPRFLSSKKQVILCNENEDEKAALTLTAPRKDAIIKLYPKNNHWLDKHLTQKTISKMTMETYEEFVSGLEQKGDKKLFVEKHSNSQNKDKSLQNILIKSNPKGIRLKCSANENQMEISGIGETEIPLHRPNVNHFGTTLIRPKDIYIKNTVQKIKKNSPSIHRSKQAWVCPLKSRIHTPCKSSHAENICNESGHTSTSSSVNKLNIKHHSSNAFQQNIFEDDTSEDSDPDDTSLDQFFSSISK